MIALLSIVIGIFYFYVKKDINLLLLSCILFLVYFELKNKNEHMSTDEAIQNLSSMFNSNTITCKNLKVIGNADVGGVLSTNGNININNDVIFKDNIKLNGKLNIVGSTNLSGDVNIAGKLTSSDIITAPKAKLGKFRFENNIVSDDQFHIINKNGAGSRFVFQNDGNILGYRCDGWVSSGLNMGGTDRGWGRGCSAKPDDATFN